MLALTTNNSTFTLTLKKALNLRHWSGILQWKLSSINNGILEGLNSVIQAE
jgi:hypothetical protein